jgi:hypothetical protein
MQGEGKQGGTISEVCEQALKAFDELTEAQLRGKP